MMPTVLKIQKYYTDQMKNRYIQCTVLCMYVWLYVCILLLELIAAVCKLIIRMQIPRTMTSVILMVFILARGITPALECRLISWQLIAGSRDLSAALRPAEPWSSINQKFKVNSAEHCSHCTPIQRKLKIGKRKRKEICLQFRYKCW